MYSGLSIVTPSSLASQWTEQIFPAGGGLPADFDVSTPQNGGIPVGGTVGTVSPTVTGFAVDFTWLGQGQPGSQPFQVSDPYDFALLQSGNTISTVSLGTLQGGTASNPVPLPSGPLVSEVGGTIAGEGSQDYYSFLWGREGHLTLLPPLAALVHSLIIFHMVLVAAATPLGAQR